ncbi:portal protein [Zooshikella ganghwensis]|uniref:portal protein n=1 Tax=Zooshikella ganghwensis TaxID=202772 RepID=UPI001BAE9CD5|nr:hypothetical protein [Zooshikella ganghwensis]
MRFDRPSENEQDTGLRLVSSTNNEWILLAQQAYTASTDYIQSGIFHRWQKALAHFNNQHAPGSKYYSKAFAWRSRTFRPKTRAALIGHEASAAAALFTNNDLVDTKAWNPSDPIQQASAKMNKALVQYRLERSIPWFQTVLGAYQNCHNYGFCISKQTWYLKYETYVEHEPVVNEYGIPEFDDSGDLLTRKVEKQKIVKDQPYIDLVAPNNFRFSPDADWRNPIDTSPFLIEQVSMSAGDVLARMEEDDPKTGEKKWNRYSLEEILAAGTYKHEILKNLADGDLHALESIRKLANEYATVWVQFNIINKRGTDYAFWTLGTSLLLSQPVRLTDLYPYGRPYVFGTANIEAHKSYPSGLNALISSLQEETNDVANQRLDNVKQVMNRPWFVKQGASFDASRINVPNAVHYTKGDPREEVHSYSMPDITSSSYAEHDRLAVEMDDLAGNLSQSSVQNNRALNETVGGMNLMSSGANSIQELMLRIFIETWVEPVLLQIVQLEQLYETDEVLLALAANDADVAKENITDELIQQQLLVSVNVGLGNTSPTQKIEKLNIALGSVSSLPTIAAKIDEDEVAKEIFSTLGYGDGKRFIKSEEKLQEQGQQQAQEQPDGASIELEIKQQMLAFEQQKFEQQMTFNREKLAAELEMQREKSMIEFALKEKLSLAELQAKLEIADRQNTTKRDITATQEINKMNELNYKKETGNQGI